MAAARTWVLAFVRWYNQEHRHSGLNFVTPNERHEGKSGTVFARRIDVYEEARRKHPSRWSRGIRNWSMPDEVWLNPEKHPEQKSQKKHPEQKSQKQAEAAG